MSTKCVSRVTSSGLVEGVILGFDAVDASMLRKTGLKLVVSLSYVILKVYRNEFLSSLYLKMKVFMKRNCHTYSLNKQIYNRLIKTCWVPSTQPCAINFGQVKVLIPMMVSTWTSMSRSGFPGQQPGIYGLDVALCYGLLGLLDLVM